MPRWIENTIRVLVYGPFALLIVGVAVAGFVLWVDGAFEEGPDAPLPAVGQADHGVPIAQQMEMIEVDKEGNSLQAVRAEREHERADRTKEKRSASSSGWYRFTESSVIGCRSRDDYDRLTSFATSGDREAFAKALASYRLQGECRMFNAGDEVFLEDLTFTMRKLRPRGGVNAFWVSARQDMLEPAD